MTACGTEMRTRDEENRGRESERGSRSVGMQAEGGMWFPWQPAEG